MIVFSAHTKALLSEHRQIKEKIQPLESSDH